MFKGVLAAIASAVLLSPVARACAITVTYSVPEMARGAKVIVEATALDRARRFEVVRTFRGNAPALLPIGIRSNCDDPTVPGEKYLVFLRCETLPGCDEKMHVVPATQQAIRQLLTRRRITQREIATMLRQWLDHGVSDRRLAEWVNEMQLTATVDDWTIVDDYEFSLSLGALRTIGIALDGEACSVEHLRHDVAPALLRLLRKRSITARDLEEMDRYEDAAGCT